MSWPMTLIMFFEFMTGLVDVYIAGKIGKEIQAAYGFIIQLYFVFIIVGNALTVGAVSIISRLFTAGNKDDLTEAIYSTLSVTIVAGLLLGIGGVCFYRPYYSPIEHTAYTETLGDTPWSDLLSRTLVPLRINTDQRNTRGMQDGRGIIEDNGCCVYV